MIDYRNEKIVIIGMGLTGLSCIKFFLLRGVTPKVMDTRPIPPHLAHLPYFIPRHFGSLKEAWLRDATLIILSPGIPLSHPALISISPKTPILGDIELFSREAQAPIIAITGSNGKSTVTCMLKKMITAAGCHVGVGGNIGVPALSLLEKPAHFYLLELSSFQLETTYNLQAKVATVLNISEDHMDRYSFGFRQYQEAKLSIYRNASICVVNIDDPLSFPKEKHNQHYISFGIDQGDYCLHEYSKKTWLMRHNEKLLECSEMSIHGRHNYINALAALALAEAIGIPRKSSLEALQQFRNLAHRFELVLDRKGVRWINDSKATNIGSTKAALTGYVLSGMLHLLLGGDGKSATFTLLAPLLRGKRVRLYCFGKDGAQLASLYPDIAILTETLEQAMKIIGKQVKQGDTVLLSPACSSLDQFSNFEMRGEVFSRLAHEIG